MNTWIVLNKLPLLVVKYEDLVRNRIKEVSRMLSFLEVDVSDEELKKKLEEDYR